jgi:hypothetical protein
MADRLVYKLEGGTSVATLLHLLEMLQFLDVVRARIMRGSIIKSIESGMRDLLLLILLSGFLLE